jgi:hypothetical protein
MTLIMSQAMIGEKSNIMFAPKADFNIIFLIGANIGSVS